MDIPTQKYSKIGVTIWKGSYLDGNLHLFLTTKHVGRLGFKFTSYISGAYISGVIILEFDKFESQDALVESVLEAIKALYAELLIQKKEPHGQTIH